MIQRIWISLTSFKYPSLIFQYSSRVRCKNEKISIYDTILPEIFNRKLGVPVRKEQKINRAFLLKDKFGVLNALYIKTIKKEILKIQICLWHCCRNSKDFPSILLLSVGFQKRPTARHHKTTALKLREKSDLVVEAEDWTVGLQRLELCYIAILPYGPGQVQSIPEGPDFLQVCFGLKNAERLWRSHSRNLNNAFLPNRKKPETMMTCTEWAYTKCEYVAESNRFQKSLSI